MLVRHPTLREVLSALAALFVSVFYFTACGASQTQMRDASSEADTYFQKGAFALAETSYRQSIDQVAGDERARVLYRTALSILGQESSQSQKKQTTVRRQRQRGRKLLIRVITEHPSSPYTQEARVLLRQLGESAHLVAQLQTERKRLEDLRDMLGQLSDLSSELTARAERNQDYVELLAEEREAMETKIDELKGRLSRQGIRVQKLEKQLAALKRIDLDEP